MNKPLSLRIQEFQQNISNIIGESELPIYMIKYIIKDLLSEIDNIANDFAQKEIQEYQESLKEESEKEESDEN